MNTSSRRIATGFAVFALNLAGVACSSSTPLRKTGDAAVGRDLGADQQSARDAAPDAAGPDLAGPDLLVQVVPDAPPVVNDAVLADLPAGKDAVLADLPAGKDTVQADLPVAFADAPASDAPAGDVPLPADLVTRDGPADRGPLCTPGILPPPCNDDPMSAAIMGTCQPDGTCACNTFYVLNPSTGRCMNPMYPKRDASASSEAGPAAICTGEYTACGCGCCGGVQATPRCYYPSLGETIAAITAQDEATKSASNCALAGCSMGLHYLCCTPAAPASSSSATYAATGYTGGLDHVTVTKSGADCATLSFARPMSSANSALRITMPVSWGVAGGLFGTCGDAGAKDQATGAVGTFALRASGSLCLADVHATLFAFTATGEAKTTLFDIDGVTVTGLSAGLCK